MSHYERNPLQCVILTLKQWQLMASVCASVCVCVSVCEREWVRGRRRRREGGGGGGRQHFISACTLERFHMGTAQERSLNRSLFTDPLLSLSLSLSLSL